MSGVVTSCMSVYEGKKQEKDKSNQTAFFLCQQMANDICDKLIRHKQWLRYTDASLISHVGGIYVIGVKRSSKRAITYLYLGQSKDVHDRIKKHKYGKQKIDGFIRRNFGRNGGKDLRVKWIQEQRHKFKEGVYITCMEKKLDYKLKYNMKGGNN